MSTIASKYIPIKEIRYRGEGEGKGKEAAFSSLLEKLMEIKQVLNFITNLPVVPTYAKEIFKEEKIKAIRGTTGIEGNVLNEEQIKVLLEAKGAHTIEELEVINSGTAHDFIIDWSLRNPDEPITEALIKQIHKYNTQDIAYPNNQPGKYRGFEVTYGYPPKKTPLKTEQEVESEMKKLVEWINDERLIFFPIAPWVIKGILTHYAIARIHPFSDGNGRTARAIEALIFFHKAKINDYCFYGISNYCYRHRNTYIEELSKVDVSGDATSFLKFCLDGFVESITTVKERIIDLMSKLLFMDYVHDLRRDKKLRKNEVEIIDILVKLKGIPYHDYFKKYFPNRSDKTKERYLKKFRELDLVEVIEKDGKKDSIAPNLMILKKLRRFV